MLVEIWTVSIIILLITYGMLDGNLSKKILIKSIFPTMFANNWYMTCYLLFYPIHPLLNRLINQTDQKGLFRITFFMTGLYVFLDFIKGDWFFPSPLILWITIYLMIAYMQKYLMKYADDKKINLTVFIINAICYIGIILVTEVAGQHIAFLNAKMMRWDQNCNPFLIFMSISMFNIARNIHFKNSFINYISSLSLLIYVIHENLILRTYFRPAMWNYVHTTFGYSHVLAWVFGLAAVIFLFGIGASALYSLILQRLVKKISNRLYRRLRRKYLKFEKQIVSL